MKLLILTYGTEGDTRPLVALGDALRGAGHKVHVLGDARTLGSAEEAGLPHSALSGDIRQLFSEWSGQGPKGTAKALVQLTNAHTRAWMLETLAAAEGCDAILTSGLAGFVGLSVAERLGIPAIGTGMIPLTPSREFASPFLPAGVVPRWLNHASLRLTNQLFWLAFRKTLNEARQTVLGLPPRRTLPTEHPMLYGISPTILPQPADWPAHARLCGQWQTPAGEFTPPPELASFLNAGPSPIYIGFGSMVGIDEQCMMQTLITALAGRRALFYPGWSGMDDIVLPDNILRIGTTPHDWLFPRTAAVIHHGGSGTTHTATRAGKPSIVIPFAGDQSFWAERLTRLGIAPPAIDAAKLNATSLQTAIDFVDSLAVQRRAAELGERMEREGGLDAAVREVEKLIGR
ncbi:glycosyltransferase [Aromatoleum petrolei]|uniref:Glycosyltransferase n=1 Tax=Aromatoleum petrolei TaxID=76116 RepID=A0ABX1MMN0_9RHOO|nr:glycosyltransferase [Aromatoleum petrolei]NMF89028.1 glycosyltransferase [Aromatoleum petrolei]QTQ34388.1 Glycosyltransferase family 28 protein [Aromatoleum petrolei]